MNYAEIQKQAVQWMANRGWKNKWGKRGQFTQSLLQHTDIELNALCTLLPILTEKAHYGLDLYEQQALIVGTIAHDVGKETAEWQHYIELQQGGFVPHVIPELTDKVVPELVSLFSFNEAVIGDAASFVNLHMSATRTATSLMGVIAGISSTPSSNRWNVLARIVEAIDKFCSIRGLLQARDYLADQKDGGVISPHIQLRYYLTTLRGVSTTFLHYAADRAYQDIGWKPMLYFSNGTIYVSDSRVSVNELSIEDVLLHLNSIIEQSLPVSFFPKMVVGSPLGTMIPKPELFDYQELELYLKEASLKMRRGSFLRKPAPTRMSVMKNDKGGGYWQLGKKPVARQNLEDDSERIDRARPLMMVFKLFRDAIKPELVGKIAGLAAPEKMELIAKERDKALASDHDAEEVQKRYDKARVRLERDGELAFEAIVTNHYDRVFGDGSFAKLQSTSTLMPAREMVAVIDPFWALPGKILGLRYKTLELAPDGEVEAALIAKLGLIGSEIYAQLPTEQRPTRVSSAEIAASFMNDLIHPTKLAEPRKLAETQMAGYRVSKPEVMRDRVSARMCPICNCFFEKGTAATADFLSKPDSHTNRAVSHGRTGKVMICDACKYERFLQQLMLGEKAERVLVLTPRMHIGYWAGQVFYEKALQFYEEAQMLMTNSTTNPNENVTLTLTNVIARKLLEPTEEGSALLTAIREGLDGKSLAHLLTYTLGGANASGEANTKQREYRRKLEKALRENYELEEGQEDIAILNSEWETSFDSWATVVEAVIKGEVRNEIADEIRSNTYNLRSQFKVICHTPNFILIPLSERSIGNFAVGKESDTNAALRELFVLLLMGLALDCSVAAIDTGSTITFEGGEGVARVPGVAAVRDLVGAEWVGLTEAPIWLEKIGAASLLANDSAYPERSNLYQILTAMTPGHVLRRIEMKQKQGVSIHHPQLILKALQEVPNA